MTVQDQPTLWSHLEFLKHLLACSTTKRLPTEPLGHLYQVVHAPVYALHTVNAYPARAVHPGKRPTFFGPEADIASRNIENTFAVNFKLYQNKNTMDLALIERFYCMLGDCAEDLRDKILGIANPTLLQFHDTAIAQWDYSAPSSRKANIVSITNPWHKPDVMKNL